MTTLCDDIYYHLLPFLKLETLKNLSLCSKFHHQVVFDYVVSQNKSILLKFKQYSSSFFDQGSKIVSSNQNIFSKSLCIFESLNNCLKFFPIVKKTLKRLKTINVENLFCNILTFVSNKKFNRLFLNQMDDFVELFPQSVQDEIYNQTEKLFLKDFPNYHQTGQCDEITEAIYSFSSSNRPLKRYHQMLKIEGLEWAEDIQKYHFPEFLANVYRKYLTLDQLQKSLTSMKDNKSFYKMSLFSQQELMMNYIGSICVHDGFSNETTLSKITVNVNQTRFITSFFDSKLVEKRFLRLLDENILENTSDIIHSLLSLDNDSFETFLKFKHQIFCSSCVMYSLFQVLSKMKPKMIENLLNDPSFINFIESDYSYEKRIQFLFCCLSNEEFNRKIKGTTDHRSAWKQDKQSARKVFFNFLNERAKRLL